jgi:alpha-D-xyloside xylohydrolase
MRAMHLEFPDDPACDTLDRQYMLGDALLVAPVFQPDGAVDYYLPHGRWVHALDGRTIDGGRWLRETYDFKSLPLWVRQNTLVPVGPPDVLDCDHLAEAHFELHHLGDGATATATVHCPSLEDSAELSVRRTEDRLEVTASRPGMRLLLFGVESVQHSEGVATEPHAKGLLLRLEGTSAQVRL